MHTGRAWHAFFYRSVRSLRISIVSSFLDTSGIWLSFVKSLLIKKMEEIPEKAVSIAILDDDPRICNLLERALRLEGFRALVVGSRQELLKAANENAVQAVILDLGLPDDDGIDIARELRRCSDIPLLMLTGRSQIADRVTGLDAGADDYILKPFVPEELLARLRSTLRRRPPRSYTGSGRLRIGTLECDPAARTLRAPDGREVSLTERELDLILLLARNPNQVMSRERLSREAMARVWNPADRSLDVHIAHLRRKAKELAQDQPLIASVRSGGYRLVAPVVFL